MTDNLVPIDVARDFLAPNSTRARVLIADDHCLVAAGLASLLADQFELLGTVADGRSAIEAAVKSMPDIVLMDISMPLLNGIEAARQLRVACPGSKIIFVTVHSNPIYVAEALAAGASGYVLKDSAPWELPAAIQKVLQGGIYVTPLIEYSELERLRGERSEGGSRLSGRQREVLQLVAEGRSAKEIGGILKISRKTVEFHKNLIMKKLNLHSTAQLARYAARERLVDG